MTNKQSYRPAMTRTRARAHDILAATDLLRRLMSELHSLRAAIASPLLAMAIDAHELHEQLPELLETVRMLTKEAERCRHKVPLGLDCPRNWN
jgi:hypothetical protein